MNGLIYANIAASAAALAVLLFRRFFKEKIFSKIFVLLWAVTIIRLLVPFEFSSAVSVYTIFDKNDEVHFEVTVPTQKEEEPVHITETPHDTAYPTMEAPTRVTVSFKDAAYTVWIIGAVFSGTYFSLRHFCAVRKIMSGAVPFDELPEDLKNIRVYKSKNVSSPLSFGVFSPRIVVPDNVPEEQLPFVLLHERTHIKNHDAVLKVLSAAALSLNWFNPFAWIAAKYLCLDMERRCDESVLSVIGKEKAAFYANTILDFAERESLSLSYLGAAPISERIVSIMKNKNRKANLPAVLCIFAAVLIMMTACGTTPRTEKLNPEKTGTEETDSEKILYLYPTSGQPMCYEGDEFFRTYSSGIGRMYALLDADCVCASAAGTVTETAEDSEELGNYIVIEHADGNKTLYAFCGRIFVEEGQSVEAGEKISDLHIDFLEGEAGNKYISKSVWFKFITEETEEDANVFINVSTGDIVAVNTENELESQKAELEKSESAAEIAKDVGYMTLEEITAAGYYPCWMQPHSTIIYDENGNPTIENGGELLPEDLVGRPEFAGEGAFFTYVGINDPFMMIQPNTKAEYDLHGFIQNIYFLWPDGNYNLSPYDMEAFIGSLIEFKWPCEEVVVTADMESYQGHTGIDIGHEPGSEIYAAADGTVIEAVFKHTGYGRYIVIDHGNGYQTCYAHCSELLVEVGQKVSAGDIIALTGSSGNSTGSHLHFEIRINGEYHNPLDYISP